MANLTTLKNTYFIMRHGQSQANVRGIIISHPDSGVLDEFGLSGVGRDQAHQSAVVSSFGADLVIYSSDFSRARQTAEIVREASGAGDIILSEKLRERQFGDWERSSHDNYESVWSDDSKNSAHTINHVESIDTVLSRATELIVELESLYMSRTILLVSHGDTLQILQTGFQKVDPASHRLLQHLETAEIRQMKLVV